MYLLLDIIGYGFLFAVIAGVFYVFYRLLSAGFNTLRKHND